MMIDLLKALFKFQSEIGTIKKDSKGQFAGMKYASLHSVLSCIRPAMTECGLMFTQTTTVLDESNMQLRTSVFHVESGQHIDSDYLIVVPKMNTNKVFREEKENKPIVDVKWSVAETDPQSIAGQVTYAKRYSLMSLLGLVGEDEDDDAGYASKNSYRNGNGNGGAPCPLCKSSSMKSKFNEGKYYCFHCKHEFTPGHASTPKNDPVPAKPEPKPVVVNKPPPRPGPTSAHENVEESPVRQYMRVLGITEQMCKQDGILTRLVTNLNNAFREKDDSKIESLKESIVKQLKPAEGKLL